MFYQKGVKLVVKRAIHSNQPWGHGKEENMKCPAALQAGSK